MVIDPNLLKQAAQGTQYAGLGQANIQPLTSGSGIGGAIGYPTSALGAPTYYVDVNQLIQSNALLAVEITRLNEELRQIRGIRSWLVGEEGAEKLEKQAKAATP